MTDRHDHDLTLPAGLGLMRAIDEADVGSVIAERYRLDDRIGSGGMGAVWHARDLVLERDVAVKLVILATPLARGRFVREGKVAARLNHPGLCKVYDVGEQDGVGHLVMELLAGETLHGWVHRAGARLEQRLSVTVEVARAMAAAHAQGLVHRDLKPDNIFLDRLGDRERVVVIDFGLAFLDGAEHGELGRLTQSDVTGGTPAYMAPEQARALAVSPSADVYALGCVLFELLAGRPPFVGAPTVVMSHQVFTTPPELADLAPEAGPGLTALVTAMLAKVPAQRPTMAEVADRLELLAVAAGTATPRTSTPELRVHRMLTRNAEATSALPLEAAIGALIVIGPIADEVLVAAASAGLSAHRAAAAADAAALARAEPRAIILADVDDDDAVVALCRLGPPVIAVASVGDLDRAVRLGRLGCVDVVTRPIQPEAAARKILRALRRLPTSSP